MSIVCGNRAHDSLRIYLAVEGQRPALVQVHHATTDEVRQCFATGGGSPTIEDEDLRREAEAEAAAERAAERWYEDGGPHAASIAAEYEQERREEERRGVIGFAEASAQAEFAHADDRMWS